MKQQGVLCAMIIVGVNISACSPIHTNSNLTIDKTQVSAPTSVPISVLAVQPNAQAKQVIYDYYQYINDHNYTKAYHLEGPQTKNSFEFDQQVFQKYKYTKVVLLKDVTSKPGFLPWDLSRYYVVKVYYGILDVKASDPQSQKVLDYYNHRRFLVVKESKDGPWLLNLAQGYPADEAESLWGK